MGDEVWDEEATKSTAKRVTQGATEAWSLWGRPQLYTNVILEKWSGVKQSYLIKLA